MKAFEIVPEGFDGSTDTTDHLIKWVRVTDSLTGKLEELGQKIGAKVYPLAGVHLE